MAVMRKVRDIRNAWPVVGLAVGIKPQRNLESTEPVHLECGLCRVRGFRRTTSAPPLLYFAPGMRKGVDYGANRCTPTPSPTVGWCSRLCLVGVGNPLLFPCSGLLTVTGNTLPQPAQTRREQIPSQVRIWIRMQCFVVSGIGGGDGARPCSAVWGCDVSNAYPTALVVRCWM